MAHVLLEKTAFKFKGVDIREKAGFHCIEELRLILDLPPGQPIRKPRSGGNGKTTGKRNGAGRKD